MWISGSSLVKAKVSKLSEIVSLGGKPWYPGRGRKHKPECLPMRGWGEFAQHRWIRLLPSHLTASSLTSPDIVHDPPLACVHGYPQKGFIQRFLYRHNAVHLTLDLTTRRGLWSSNWPDVKAEGLLELFHGCSIIFSLKGFLFKLKRKKFSLLPCY